MSLREKGRLAMRQARRPSQEVNGDEDGEGCEGVKDTYLIASCVVVRARSRLSDAPVSESGFGTRSRAGRKISQGKADAERNQHETARRGEECLFCG